MGDNSDVARRQTRLDKQFTVMQERHRRVVSDMEDLKSAVRNLNRIVTSMRVQVSDLRRTEIPDQVYYGKPDDQRTAIP